MGVQKTPKYNITFLDHSAELSTTSVCLKPITAATFDDVIDPTDKWPAALKLAITACSFCNDIKHQVTLDPQVTARVTPNDERAQREQVLVVSYQDLATHDMYTMSIPGPNRGAIGREGDDKVNPASVLWLALVLALETHAVSPDGNPIKVIGGRFAGRAS